MGVTDALGGRCCGTCEWHEREDMVGGWVCVNKYGNCCTERTEDDFCCPCWRKREG